MAVARVSVNGVAGSLEYSDEQDLMRKVKEIKDAGQTIKFEKRAGEGEALLRGLGQGATFGWQDEMAGMLDAAFTDKTYEEGRDESRALNASANAQHPGSYITGELSSALIPGAGMFKGAQMLNRGRQLLNPAGRMAAAGVAAGGVGGAGFSEDNGMGLAADTALGAGVGGVMGPAIGKGLQLAGRSAQRGVQSLRNMATETDKGYAQKHVRGLLEADDIVSPSRARSALEDLGPEGRLVDSGPNTVSDAELISKKVFGQSKKLIDDSLRTRQAGQQNRLKEAARDTIDPVWTDYWKFIDDLDVARKAQASPMYAAARDKGVRMTENMKKLMSKPSIKRGLKKAKAALDDELDAPLGNKIVQEQGVISLNIFDQTLKSLQDDIGKAMRAGTKEKAARLIRLKKALEKELYDQVPEYKKARNIWAGSKQLENAAELGRDLLNKGRLYDVDVSRMIRDMTDSELDSMRIGLVRSVFDKVESGATSSNSAKSVFGHTRVRNMLKEVFPDEESFTRFMKTIDAEDVMNQTQQQIRGGSRTMSGVDNSGLINIDSGDMMAAASGSGGMALAAVRKIWNHIANKKRANITEEQANEVAKLLFGDMSDEQLQRIFSSTVRGSVPSVPLNASPAGRNVSLGISGLTGQAPGAMMGTGGQ